MNILFIEDNINFIDTFKNQLSSIGNVIHFKSLNSTLNYLNDNFDSIDFVVCDHNILIFENEPQSSTNAIDIYLELRMMDNSIPFIHFSADPCPEKYSKSDHNFYTLEKNLFTNLVDFINQNNIIKKQD